MYKIIFLALLLPSLLPAQDLTNNVSVRFENNQSWQEIKARAKAEKKYILVDCYATWCGPCKYMDKEVFEKTIVANFVNERFICVKVQADTSKTDNDYVKSWYKDARDLIKAHKVFSLPTFLFFSPEGTIVHRFTGALNDTNFISLTKNALDSTKQYYTWVNQFRAKKPNYGYAKNAIRTSREVGNASLADSITRNYMYQFLAKQVAAFILKKKELDFLLANGKYLKSTDALFQFVVDNSDVIDTIMEVQNSCVPFLTGIITKEYITPFLPSVRSTRDADWPRIEKSIKHKFPESWAEKSIVQEKLKWYTARKDWNQVIDCHIKLIDMNGIDTAGVAKYFLNNMIYSIFLKHCNNKEGLEKAISWMETILHAAPHDVDCIDTYANLLYKNGNQSKAIEWEEKALLLEQDQAKAENRQVNDTFKETVNKMKQNIPTWID